AEPSTADQVAPEGSLRYTVPWLNCPQPARRYEPSAAFVRSRQSAALCTCDQVAPASVERHRPVFVAATTTVPETATSLLTKKKLLLAVVASWAQLPPLSVLLKMPAPRTASALKKPSPVPA